MLKMNHVLEGQLKMHRVVEVDVDEDAKKAIIDANRRITTRKIAGGLN